MDSADRAFITGVTTSADFPTLDSLQSFNLGAGGTASDAYIVQADAQLTGALSLLHSTYVGGSGLDVASGITLDGRSRPWITGVTASVDFPVTLDAVQSQYAGAHDAFVTALDETGLSRRYSTYYGGSRRDEAYAIASYARDTDFPDNAGVAIAGLTFSTDFPADDTNGTPIGTTSDAFVVRFVADPWDGQPDDWMVDHAEQFGGSGNDAAYGLSGDLYVTGRAESAFPNAPVLPPNWWDFHGGAADAFLWLHPAAGDDGWFDDGTGNEMEIVVVAPPADLQATALASDRVRLNWRNRDSDAWTNLVQRKSVDAAGWTNVASLWSKDTSWTDENVSIGVQYRYRVWALRDSEDIVDHSNGVTIATQKAPNNLKAVVTGSKKLTLSWTNQNPRVQQFEIERVGNGTTFTHLVPATAVAVGAVQKWEETGLAIATDYTYRVRALDSRGATSFSSALAASTTALAPPTGVLARASSSTRVILSWGDASTAETSFVIERRLSSDLEFVKLGVGGANVTSFTSTVPAPEVVYEYRVFAANALGKSDYAPVATVKPPAAPGALTATPLASTRVELRWEDRSRSESGYLVERREATSAEFSLIKSLGANVKAYRDTVPATDIAYHYRVTAHSPSGVSTPAVTQATPISAATQLKATARSSTIVDLTWIKSGLATGYRIERRAGTTGAFTPLRNVGTVEKYADTVPAPEQTYYYRVFALRGTGVSSASNTGSAVVMKAPALLSATVLSRTQVRVTWDDLTNKESGYLIQRKRSTETWESAVTVKVGGNIETYTAGGLNPGTSYHFRVQAFNSAHRSGFSAVKSATTLP